jgi:hypothetical protein
MVITLTFYEFINIQIPDNFKIQISNNLNNALKLLENFRLNHLNLEHWCLFGIWCLGFVISSSSVRQG